MDRDRRSFCGRAHPRQNEGGSHRAAGRATEKICETTGNNSGDDSDTGGDCRCQRKPESDRGGNQPHACKRESNADSSSYGHHSPGRFAIGFRQNASVSFARCRGIGGAQCERCAEQHAYAGRIALRQDAPVSARAQAIAVHRAVGNSVCFIARGCRKCDSAANPAPPHASSCQSAPGHRNATGNHRTGHDSAAEIHTGKKTHRATSGDSACRYSTSSGRDVAAVAYHPKTIAAAPNSARFRIVSGNNRAQRPAGFVANSGE
ncbi:MAG: hypothetical protein QOK24_685 [Verrucomicrobiota bacterium]